MLQIYEQKSLQLLILSCILDSTNCVRYRSVLLVREKVDPVIWHIIILTFLSREKSVVYYYMHHHTMMMHIILNHSLLPNQERYYNYMLNNRVTSFIKTHLKIEVMWFT